MSKHIGPELDALLARILRIIDANGIDNAISVIRSNGDPQASGRVFSEISKILYRDRKDVAGMIAVAEAGVTFCLQEALRGKEETTTGTLKKLAKVIAFNSAANCWPGWGDEGIRIDSSHLRSGLILAGICRDLVEELQLGQKETGGAHWLLGALKLAGGQPIEALRDFQRAQQAFEAGGHTAYDLMARGYVALARKADPTSSPVGAQDFAEALAELQREGSKDAMFFANQLFVAERMLLAQ
jgi:hypothetical protein